MEELCTLVAVSDLNEKLSKIHDLLAEDVLERLESGEASNDDRRVALQLLKQNAISAVPTENSPLKNLSSKLDFSAMAEKVVPLKRPEPPTAA